MAGASFAQTSFLGGEWSQRAQGRFDRPDYRTALNVCLNWMPVESGALTRRPGTQHASTTRGGAPGRVAAFDFKAAVPYLLEFTAGFLRFRAGTVLASTNDDQVVTAISAANPAVVTTAAAHGWATGNTVRFALLGTTAPLLQARLFTITVTGATTFSLADAVTATTFDGSTLAGFAAAATVQRILEVATPYTGTLWQSVRIVQAELQAVLLHPLVPPQVLTAVPPGAGQTYYGFTLAPANLVDGPYLDPPSDGALITPSATNGNMTLTLSALPYVSTQSYKVGDFVTSVAITYQSLVDQNQGNTPASSPSQWKAVSAGLMIGPNGFVGTDIGRLVRLQDSSGNWTWGKITALQNLISPTLAGSVAIGNMTLFGGLAAAFDGLTAKPSASCAGSSLANVDPALAYVGKNYSGASAQQIAFGTLWPSSDLSFWLSTKTYTTTTTTYQNLNFGGGAANWVPTGQSSQQFTVQAKVSSVTIVLRAKATAPASAGDGTALGSASANGEAAVVVPSSDQATAWNYVWFEIVVNGIDKSVPPPVDTRTPSAPFQATAYTQTSVLNSWATFETASQAQFFNPAGTGNGNAVSFQLLGPVLPNTNTLPVWRLGAYSGTTGWPSCGTYHEGRLWLAGAIGNRLDGSVSNLPFNFSPTSAAGQVLDALAIAAIFDAPDVNTIFWLVPDQIGIICGTQAGDWLVQASALNSPLTPTSIQAHRYDRLGCANIEPRRAAGPLIVAHRFRRKLFEHFADVFSGRIGAQNVTWQDAHLTAAGIAEIAYQNELAPVVWARCDDGSWFGITYRRESLMSSQPPNFAGGHRHALGSGRTVESIAVGPSPDGLTDSLAMVTTDSTGIRHVEVLAPILAEGAPLTAAWFLDDAVAPASFAVASAGMTITGLWHLNGRTVTVYAGGLDCGDWTVVNGAVTLTYGDGISQGTGGGLFTQAFASGFGAALPIVAGFTYNSDAQIVRPMTPQESGARTGPALGKKRRAMQYALLVENAVGGAVPELGTPAGLQVGTDFAHLQPAAFRAADDATPLPYGAAFSGVFWDSLDDTASFDAMLCWRMARPWPATVAAAEPFLDTQDK